MNSYSFLMVKETILTNIPYNDIELPKSSSFSSARRMVNVAQSGKYRIAFHASSLGKAEEKVQGKEYGRQYFDDVVLEKKYKAGVPNQVSNLTVTPAAMVF